MLMDYRKLAEVAEVPLGLGLGPSTWNLCSWAGMVVSR